MMNDMHSAKCEFLRKFNSSTPEQAQRNAIIASLQRSYTYLALDGRAEFRNSLATLVQLYSVQYLVGVDEAKHLANIEAISNEMSDRFGPILRGGRFRIGIAQKVLNLYIKYLWCANDNFPLPPHCPVDRIILQAAGNNGAWTRLDSIGEYNKWIKGIRKIASENRLSVAEWELLCWNGLGSVDISSLPDSLMSARKA
jgi:hypothetical protein